MKLLKKAKLNRIKAIEALCARSGDQADLDVCRPVLFAADEVALSKADTPNAHLRLVA